MKIRNSSRITALVLALMMIVPLISVPAFAETKPIVVLATQTFDDIENVSDAVNTSNPSVTLEAVENRGNVLKFDLSEGPYGSHDKFFLVENQNNGKLAVVEYTVDETTGKYSGYFNYTPSEGADPIQLYFMDAVPRTATNTSGVTANLIYTRTVELVEKIDPETEETVYDEVTGEPVMEEKITYAAYPDEANQWKRTLVSEPALNAWRGGANIANSISVKHGTLAANIVTYSADYYFDSNWIAGGENQLMQGTFRGLAFNNSGKNISISQHGNNQMTDGASVSVADNTWFNISVVADYTDATYTVYVNGNYCFTAADSQNQGKITPNAGAIPENAWRLIQVNRNQTFANYKGYVMVDNCTIYEGEVIPTASNIPADRGNVDFNDGFGSLTTITSNASASLTSDAKYGKSESDKALLIDVNTNGSTDNASNPIIDKGAAFGHSAMSYTTNTVAVFQQDMYIPADTVVQLQSQINPIKDNGTVVNWASLWVIRAQVNDKGENVALLGHEGNPVGLTTYESVLPRDKWFTLSTVIELESGIVRMYVDGKQYSEYQFTHGSARSKISFDANKAVVVKVNKPGNNTDYFPTGFSGVVLFDNISLSDTTDSIKNYEGIRKEEVNLDFNYDFENVEIGTEVEAASKPSSAKYVDLNGNKVVQIDMRVESDTPDTLASWTGTNTDKMFKVATPKFVYSDDPEAVTTLVYSADYFVNTDAAGKMESQFHSSAYYELYEFNFNTSTISAGHGAVHFDKGVWNTVKMVVTLTADATHIDIYLNGVWIGERSYAADIISQNAWSVAKVMKRTEADQAGSFYVDNVKSEVYNADYAKTLDATLVTTATVGGTEVKLPNNSGKFYTDKEVVLGAALDINLADYAAIIETVKQSSMRIDTAEDGKSGLRFATEIDTDLLAALEAAVGTAGAVGYGHLIAPTDLLDGITLEHGCINPLLDVKNVAHKFYNLDDDDTTTHFVGSIVDIKVANYNREFTAVGYVSITLTNGTVLYIYSATTHATSVKAQAEATIGSYTEGSAEWNILNGFINPLVAE